MKIISCNVNGIRAAAQKGFIEWLLQEDADVICLQELKAQVEQAAAVLEKLEHYNCYYNVADKKGYSGVAICSKKKPLSITTHLDWPLMDEEGRYVAIKFNTIEIASVYLPSGTSGDHRQEIKYQIMDDFWPFMQKLYQNNKNCILCGDWNIAHKEIDLKNFKANKKHSGFLPEERAWLDTIFNSGLFADGFRVVNQEKDQYTWWSHRGQAWLNNTGWRIDYQVISKDLIPKITSAFVYKQQRFSDHAPLILEYNFIL